MVTLDQSDPSGGRCEDVYCQGSHARTNFHEMIPRGGFQIGDNRTGQIRIEQEILTEHLARTHPDFIETGTEFGFGHGGIHNPLSHLLPVSQRNKFFPLVPKLFTTLQAR